MRRVVGSYPCRVDSFHDAQPDSNRKGYLAWSVRDLGGGLTTTLPYVCTMRLKYCSMTYINPESCQR